MAEKNGRGWHGDSQGHREAAYESHKKYNWVPLLLLPVAFAIGWLGNDVTKNNTGVATDSTMQPGIGGGPDETLTVTPSSTPGTGR